jgi:hypothetical protein
LLKPNGYSALSYNRTKKRGPPKGYIDALEKRIQQIESTLTSLPTKSHSSPTHHSRTTQLNHHDAHPDNDSDHRPHSSSDYIDASIPVHTKTAAGGQSDSVQYLGDLSSFQFFSNKIKMDGTNNMWRGQRLRKFGKQVVLVGDDASAQLGNTGHYQPKISVPKIKTLFPGKDIHNWIYSVSGVDMHTSDRLLKM